MFKLSIYDYMNNFKRNIFTIVQFVLILILVVILSSTTLAQTGMFVALNKSVKNGKGVVAFDISEYTIKDLKKVDEVVYGRTCFPSYIDENDEKIGMSLITYNDNFSDYYQPVLLKGHWVDSIFVDSQYITCVVNQNEQGIDVGDVIEIDNCMGEKIKLYISGIIKDKQYLYIGNEFTDASHEKTDYTDLFSKLDSEQIGLIAITTDRQLSKLEVRLPSNKIANALIRFKDDISDEEIEYNKKKIEEESMTGFGIYISSLEQFYKNSLRRIRNILVTYVPIIFASIILIMSSILGYEYLLLKKLMTRYGVYYALGTKWQSMVLVPLFQKVVNSIFSVMIFISLYSLIGYTPIHNKIFMTLGKIQTLIILLICLVYISFGTFMAYRMIRKSAPDEILREAKVE